MYVLSVHFHISFLFHAMKFYAYLSLLHFIDLSSRMLVRNRDWCGRRTVAKKGCGKLLLPYTPSLLPKTEIQWI